MATLSWLAVLVGGIAVLLVGVVVLGGGPPPGTFLVATHEEMPDSVVVYRSIVSKTPRWVKLGTITPPRATQKSYEFTSNEPTWTVDRQGLFTVTFTDTDKLSPKAEYMYIMVMEPDSVVLNVGIYSHGKQKR